jgi:hypothetical protein
MSAELRRSVTDAASLAGLDQLDAIRKNPNASADVRQRAEARILTGYQTCRGQTSCNFGGLDLAKLKDCTH